MGTIVNQSGVAMSVGLRRLAKVVASMLLAAAATAAWAQVYPVRPIRIAVPLPPGGSNDLLARIIAERLQLAFGQPVIVENKPGGAGNIATEFVARQPADGYSLLFTSSAHAVNPSFFVKLPYDPIKDFEPIVLAGAVPFVLTVNASSPIRTVKEFIAHAKAMPGMTYGTAGIGAPHHLAAELMKSMTDINIVHIPYKGASGIVPALLSNEISFTIGAINSLLPHYKTGKLRAIAVAGQARTALLPDIPTIGDTLSGYVVETWNGVLAPAGTPRAIIDRLNAEINRILADPVVVNDRLAPVGIEPLGSTPERFAEVIRIDIGRYAKIARDARIKPE
ncbi:MAG: tripartite tricarboxylate transporter substrate binding protein [Betaproteobacteria bacterium]|nr:tripartite tricarboxylate transporter substrate binding protein [Betaproteobacteria bacterium]